ncbi:MAG: hypothetical protein ACUVX9_15410 [Anaerolineae bacterium]
MRALVAYAGAIRERHPDLGLVAFLPSGRIPGDLSDAVPYVCSHL